MSEESNILEIPLEKLVKKWTFIESCIGAAEELGLNHRYNGELDLDLYKKSKHVFRMGYHLIGEDVDKVLISPGRDREYIEPKEVLDYLDLINKEVSHRTFT